MKIKIIVYLRFFQFFEYAVNKEIKKTKPYFLTLKFFFWDTLYINHNLLSFKLFISVELEENL